MQGLCIVKSLGAIKVPFKSLELNELPAIGLVCFIAINIFLMDN